jgi:hypothetical protein
VGGNTFSQLARLDALRQAKRIARRQGSLEVQPLTLPRGHLDWLEVANDGRRTSDPHLGKVLRSVQADDSCPPTRCCVHEIVCPLNLSSVAGRAIANGVSGTFCGRVDAHPVAEYSASVPGALSHCARASSSTSSRACPSFAAIDPWVP